jgi:hypothetical protein
VGVEQVNRAMSQVDQVGQRNASAAEELSGTAEQMASQAEKLQQLMSVFQIETAGRVEAAVARPSGNNSSIVPKQRRAGRVRAEQHTNGNDREFRPWR